MTLSYHSDHEAYGANDKANISRKLLTRPEVINATFKLFYDVFLDEIIEVSQIDADTFVSQFTTDDQNSLWTEASELEPRDTLNRRQIMILALLKIHARSPEFIKNFFSAYQAFKQLDEEDRRVVVDVGTHDFGNFMAKFMFAFFPPEL